MKMRGDRLDEMRCGEWERRRAAVLSESSPGPVEQTLRAL